MNAQCPACWFYGDLSSHSCYTVREPPTPSPTGTELALATAKQHIATLTRYWLDNAGWHRDAEAARAFISGVPEQEGASEALPDRAPARDTPISPPAWRDEVLEEAAKALDGEAAAMLETANGAVLEPVKRRYAAKHLTLIHAAGIIRSLKSPLPGEES